MRTSDRPLRSTLGLTTSNVLDLQFARAERLVNGVRIAALGVIGSAAALYAAFLPAELVNVNVAVFGPMLTWAIAQHLLVHRANVRSAWVGPVNAAVDVTAVSVLLLCYGIFGMPDLAVKSPILVAYFLVLAARPFTGSTKSAVFAATLATVQYAAIVSFLVGSGRLTLLDSPLASAITAGTSLLDEFSKVGLLLLGGVISVYATAWNQRTLRRAAEALRSSEEHFQKVFDHSAVGILLLDESGRILETNAAMRNLTGLDSVRLSGRRLSDLTPPDDANAIRDMFSQVAESGSPTAAEVRFTHVKGQVVWGSLTLSRVQDGDSIRLIAMVQDVSQRKALEAELVRQAFHDPLTNLANRSLFRDRVDHALSRAQREPENIAVLFLDLDNFKTVNDTLGHAAGDRLLVAVAGRLLNATRGCDTAARLGGDEFAVLLENVRQERDIEIVAERIVAALRTPIEVEPGRTTNVSVSIGIARAQAGDGSDELLRNADVAMYAAKSRTRGSYVAFDPSMHVALVERVTLERDLADALARNQMRLVYQPIITVDDGTIIGVEALLRWTHPERGDVPPSQFIPMAEETGQINELGLWVLRNACEQGVYWNTGWRGDPLSITVNLSIRQLQNPCLVDDVARVLRQTGLPSECLVLEITESVLMHDAATVLDRLRALKSLGVRLAIDDFGTGYSSLSHLQQFPIDVIKIDRSFTSGIPHDANSSALARTIITLGSMLTLRTVAEGVENAEQYAELRELGCGLAQGFLFSTPVEVGDVNRLLAKGQLTGEAELVPIVKSA